jgi:hypothetical protein
VRVALIPHCPFVAGTALALPNLSCDICSPGGASICAVAVIMHVCMRTFMSPCRDTRPQQEFCGSDGVCASDELPGTLNASSASSSGTSAMQTFLCQRLWSPRFGSDASRASTSLQRSEQRHKLTRLCSTARASTFSSTSQTTRDAICART